MSDPLDSNKSKKNKKKQKKHKHVHHHERREKNVEHGGEEASPRERCEHKRDDSRDIKEGNETTHKERHGHKKDRSRNVKEGDETKCRDRYEHERERSRDLNEAHETNPGDRYEHQRDRLRDIQEGDQTSYRDRYGYERDRSRDGSEVDKSSPGRRYSYKRDRSRERNNPKKDKSREASPGKRYYGGNHSSRETSPGKRYYGGNYSSRDTSSGKRYDNRRNMDRDSGQSDSGEDAHPSSHRKKRQRSEEDEEEEEPRRKRREDEEEIPDYEFDWKSHRGTLNRIFFREEDLVKRNTEQYDDFWSFVEKYKAFHRKKAMQNTGHSGQNKMKLSSKFELPIRYDKRYRINVSLPPRDVNTYLREDRGRSDQLTKERVEQFKQILLHYIDFQQKQKISKLEKIRRDQENLPIFQYKKKIIEAVQSYPVVVVAGDTGCGKSTQVPQYLLEAGFAQIACTQPRRIACISLSKRVAYETLNEYGSQVAYQVRFEKSRTAATRIVFLTEGLLLRQIGTDPKLSRYSVIVIDEVHERHIHTDFLLGVVKCLLQDRADIKIVLMSATINIHLFSDYFEQAPVLQVPGRLYPIQLQYVPITQEEKSSKVERLNPAPFVRILQKIDHKYSSTERGDVLMFLSGMSEIMSVVEAAKAYAEHTQKWIILPLHSALSVTDQDKVFDIAPDGVRKCIVSTNIAETSVTIDGVRFVVDSGKVKEMSFDPKYKMQKLQEFWISRASAEQRKGRAGRTGPGVCFRLYEESDYDALQQYSTPEIQRVPLDSLILQMTAMGLLDARKFPFIEAPASSSIETSIVFLKEQGALKEDETLTPIGEMLSQLPVDVVIGKMLIMGAIFHMVDPVLSIAAALSVQSPFTSRTHTDYDAMNSRKNLESDHGDPFTLLNALDEWIQVKADGRGSRKWCKRRGLEEQRFYEITKLKQQFKQLLQEHGLMEGRSEEAQRYATSTERRKQHAERNKLRDLKRDHKKHSVKRKVLKLENDVEYEFQGDENEDDAPDPMADIKDLEFRLTHDLDKMQEKSTESRHLTCRDINLLKVILCSGLYPQVAIADEHNSYKADSEHAFHTKSKPFVLLHPTCVFATEADILQLKEKDIKEIPGPNSDKVFSNKHQLITYVTLLETTKPYLTGVMRVPALQTLTLYARSIDTNTDCTRLVVDGWLELIFETSEEGESVLSSAVQLRTTWLNLVELKLQAKKQEDIDGSLAIQRGRLERLLATKLTEFLSSDIFYAMRRIMAAEMAHIYRGPDKDVASENVSDVFNTLCKGAPPHPIKGGFQVNDYLTFNCIVEEDSSVWGEYDTFMQRHWTCDNCGTRMIVTVVQRLQHEQQCLTDNPTQQGTSTSETKSNMAPKDDGMDSLRKLYHCDKCNEDYRLTATEILKHKRQCGKE